MRLGVIEAGGTKIIVGIGTFGPADVNPESQTYSYILDTPKLGWSIFPFLKKIKVHLDVPMVL